MLSRCWILPLLAVGISAALGPAPHQTSEESLRSALNAVTRKQRSLDTGSQEYYNDLHSFKYHGDPERKFERERQDGRDLDMDEEIEFLTNVPDNGQLETVGDNYQSLNNRMLERALIDYLENTPDQEEAATSLFRERERSSSRKRGANPEHPNVDEKELMKFIVDELRQEGSPYESGELDDDEYMQTLQTLNDRYKDARAPKYHEVLRPMSWAEVFEQQGLAKAQPRNREDEFIDQDPNVLYLMPAERRNVNGRYPLGREYRNYRSLAKRYPVAKRSPKPLQAKKPITDPKVAQDLRALFGTQSSDTHSNHTHDHDHTHDHGQEHDQSHDHGEQEGHPSSTETPKVTPLPKGQKENATKTTKPKVKPIEVKKKSVDWSQYFGIDRRKKKATFVARQGSQNQDDEWMLQRYYENMAENLKPTEHESDKATGERKDKLDQVDSRLKKIIKDLIMEEALRYTGTEEGADMQKIKDKVMARLVAAYTLEKMSKALYELRNNVAAQKEAERIAHAQNNFTSHYHDDNEDARNDNKRDGAGAGNAVENEADDNEEKNCPELDAIERRCRTADNLAGDANQMLYLPCVMLQICKACSPEEVEEECYASYAIEAGKECENTKEGQKGKEACAGSALTLSQLQPPAAVALQCRASGNGSCLRRYYYRYRVLRYMRYPYGGHRYRGDYELPAQSSER